MIEAILTTISLILTVFIIPWLRAQAAKARASQYELERAKDVADLEMKDILLDQLKGIVYDFVANTAEKEYPRIAEKLIEDPTFTKEDVKKELYGLGRSVFDKVVLVFSERSTDILDLFGYTMVSELIRRAVDEISPFEGKETATALLESGIPSKLLKEGVQGDFEPEIEVTLEEDSDEKSTYDPDDDDD